MTATDMKIARRRIKEEGETNERLRMRRRVGVSISRAAKSEITDSPPTQQMLTRWCDSRRTLTKKLAFYANQSSDTLLWAQPSRGHDLRSSAEDFKFFRWRIPNIEG